MPDADHVLLALAGIDPDGQIAALWAQLRALHEADGIRPEKARSVAYRETRVAELLTLAYDDSREVGRVEWIAASVGVTARQVRDDIAALRRLLEPRVIFVEERAAA
jgi:hypothetical protein